MLLVFLLSGSMTILLIMFLLLLSNIKITIQELSILKNQSGFQVRIYIEISLYLLGKWKTIRMSIHNQKIKEWYEQGKFDIQKLKNNQHLNKETIKLIKQINYKVESFYLAGTIGLEDAVMTALITTLIRVITSVFLIPKINQKDHYYENVTPIYQNQNLLNLEINCIICIKIVHIINVLYIYLKKERVKKYERTSYRRAYEYSHE